MIKTKKEAIKWLLDQNDDLVVDIDIHREKRSLNSNAYLWELIVKIANVMRLSKEEVYKKMLEDYGQSQVVSIDSNIDITGFFKYFVILGESEIKGKRFTHYKILKGSSEYNTKEMNILIEGVIETCKELDIEYDYDFIRSERWEN